MLKELFKAFLTLDISLQMKEYIKIKKIFSAADQLVLMHRDVLNRVDTEHNMKMPSGTT